MREQDGRCRDQSPRWSGSHAPVGIRQHDMLPTEPLIGTFNRNSYDAHIIPQSAQAREKARRLKAEDDMWQAVFQATQRDCEAAVLRLKGEGGSGLVAP